MNPTSHEFETDRLVELVEQKLELLEQLRTLARRQGEYVQQGEMDRLLNLLAAKQKIVRQVQMTDRDLEPYRHDDPESRRWRSQELRDRCRQMADRCASLLSEVVLYEKQCTSQLEQQKQHTARRLETIDHANAARQAYTSASSPTNEPSRFLDLESY